MRCGQCHVSASCYLQVGPLCRPILLATLLPARLWSPVQRHKSSGPRCRYILGSERFIRQLPWQRRAFLTYEALQKAPEAHAFLTRLLWREPLSHPHDSDMAAAATNLMRHGAIIYNKTKYAHISCSLHNTTLSSLKPCLHPYFQALPPASAVLKGSLGSCEAGEPARPIG